MPKKTKLTNQTPLQEKLWKCIDVMAELKKKADTISYKEVLEYYRELHHKTRGLQDMTFSERQHLNYLEDWLLNFIERHGMDRP